MPAGILLTECPRDAMQGITQFIPTDIKAEYINLLLGVGFDTIDFGSFVSARAIPQMQDTKEVLKRLDLAGSKSQLLAIIANYRGAEEAVVFDEISFLGYPFSISETFQRRNTNSGIDGAFETVQRVNELCAASNKNLLIYLSMGFGNPYGDDWSKELVLDWATKLSAAGIKHLSLADTVGMAQPNQIEEVYSLLASEFKNTNLGIHLHATPGTWREKVEAAYKSGCKRFDSALKGFGGCPMAADKLTGNIATENVITYLSEQGIDLRLNMDKLGEAMEYANCIFRQ